MQGLSKASSWGPHNMPRGRVEQLARIDRAGITVDWPNRRRKGFVLIGAERRDLAARCRDGGARLLVLLDSLLALDGHRGRHRLPHRLLQILRPGLEGGAVQKYRPRNI